MGQVFTALIRKSKLEYVAICLELNITARGSDLAEVEKNLKDAIEIYLEDIKEHPETVVSPISIEELIEFLKDTEPDWLKEEKFIRPLEVHEVPSYV
jgi:predicted RNase H-like HicB family nuclease